jgi:hypothetical protein
MRYTVDGDEYVRQESHKGLMDQSPWYRRAYYILEQAGPERTGVFARIAEKMDKMLDDDYPEMASALAEHASEMRDPYGYRGLSMRMFI